jgi:PPM family protein phosphatase
MGDLMPIGVFAERSGLSPKRLRSYAAAGLLVPTAVDDESGYRYYAPGQVLHARVIDALRRADLPVKEIRALMLDPSACRLDEWERRVELHGAERRAALRQARELLAIGRSTDTPDATGSTEQEASMYLNAVTHSDVGRVRERNEDRAIETDRLLAVADGMGGSPGGDVAASTALAVVAAAFAGRSLDELAAGVRASNAAVLERAHDDERLEGMGTTLCAVGLTDAGELAVVNVGDSRAYRLRDGSLDQLTTDHSLTAELVRQGTLSPDAAADHPDRPILTRALGVGPSVDVDGAVHTIAAGDRLLLCSDGLWSEVSHDEIRSSITPDRDHDLDSAARELIDHALAAGGRDNVTVVVAEVQT